MMATLITIVIVIAVYFTSAFYLTGVFRRYALNHILLDIPNKRTSHEKPTPRGGGMAFIIIWCTGLLAGAISGKLALAVVLVFMPAALMVAVIGFIDDHYNLSLSVRLVTHIVAATAFIMVLGGGADLDAEKLLIKWGIAGSIVAIIAIVWSINLFNFMDGIDSIASVEAIIVFLAGGAMLWHAGGTQEGALALLLAVSVAGFLIWNLPPAKIFMGDGGSGFLGFLIVAFAITGEINYGMPVLLWVIIYGVFWFDAAVTLLRRMLRGEAWTKPHRSHAYQRLHQSGWSHGSVVKAVSCLNAILIVFAIAAYVYPSLLLSAFILSLALLSTAYILIERRKPMTRTP